MFIPGYDLQKSTYMGLPKLSNNGYRKMQLIQIVDVNCHAAINRLKCVLDRMSETMLNICFHTTQESEHIEGAWINKPE